MADIDKKKVVSILQKKDKTDKTQQRKNEKTESVTKKVMRHKMLIAYRYIAILTVIGIIILISYINWKNKIYSDYEIVSSQQWTRTENTVCIPLENTIFTYTKDGMSCIDAKGKTLWNVTYEMQNPVVRTCKNVVAVGDYNGRKIYLCNTSKTLGQIDTTIPIRDFCVSANGIVAAVLDDMNVTAIYLYDTNGKQIAYFKTTMSKSGYPLALTISDNSQMVAVSYLQANQGSVSSNVAFYNFSAVGENYTDNLVGGYGYADAVVPYVAFMNEETVCAVADNRLMFYGGNQTPVNIADVMLQDEIQGVYHNNECVGLIFYNTDGDSRYRLELYDTKGKKIRTIKFELEYSNIQLEKDCIIISNESEFEIYNWKGVRKFKGNFKENAYAILPTGSITKYTIVTGNTIQSVELR